MQWNPITLCAVHDWNVIFVPDGRDHRQILAAQRLSAMKLNEQPTAIVYRTVKGWHYGIEGRKSHGAGHKFCSPEFYASLDEFGKAFGTAMPKPSCVEADDHESLEAALWEMLTQIRGVLQKNTEIIAQFAAVNLAAAKTRLAARKRTPRADAPKIEPVFDAEGPFRASATPAELALAPGKSTTLRGALGDAIGHLNKATSGGFLGSAADLYGSTSLSNIGAGFPGGFYNAITNRGSRLLAAGGICEDAMGGIAGGLAAYGHHVGVTSSYGAFLAALEHVPARLHAIGQQMRPS